MDLSKINADFTADTEPKDEHLIELLKHAYTGEILCRMAVADLAALKPFSGYQPTVSDDYRRYFTKKAQDGSPPVLYVYAQDGKLIMSDDYNAFTLYRELNMPEAICLVVGDTPKIDGVIYHGDPFKLPPPSVEVLPES